MAKNVKGGESNIRDIIADIRAGKPAPVYILHGEEPYYMNLIVENLEKYVVSEEDRDFNVDIFYGADADVDYVIAAAQQFPVMAARRMVILKEAQGIHHGRATLDRFAPYIVRPNDTTVFVIVFKGDNLAATSELMKAAKQGGAVVFRSDLPQDWNIIAHVKDYCTEHRISIDDKAMTLMIESVGTPLSKLFGELDKLAAIKGKGERITVEDVERNIGVSKDFNNFELVNAIATKDYPKAIRIIKYFEDAPKDTNKNKHSMMSASTIFNFFANLVAAHYLSDKSDESLMRELGLKARIQLNTVKTGMRNYSAMKAVNAIHHLREFDAKSKGIDSFQKSGALLGELLFKLFT